MTQGLSALVLSCKNLLKRQWIVHPVYCEANGCVDILAIAWGSYYYYWIIENLVKMAKYHCWAKYLAIYHCFGNIYECTTLLELEFFEKIAFKVAMLFFMELKCLELELHKKLVAIFHGTWVPKIRVTWQTRVSQTQISKK